MSLVTQLTDLITRIGTEIKTMKSQYSGNSTGNLSGLNTSSKTSLLSAINEINTLAGGKQANLGFTPENAAQKGIANGYAGLDGSGRVPIAQLPAVLNSNKGFFATQSALTTAYPTANDGDYAIVGSTDTVWMWDSGTTAWVETDKKGQVQSVNGQTGVVVIADVSTSGNSGLMTVADKNKLNGIASGATANSTDATLLNRANHTGTQLAATISNFAATVITAILTGFSTATATAVLASDTVLAAFGKLQGQINGHFGVGGATHPDSVAAGASGFMSGADKTKLNGVAMGATANSADATLLARANHTGTQLAATISDFAASVLANLLTGLSVATNSAIAATDSVLVAFGKLQAQITGHVGSGGASHANVVAAGAAGFMTGADKTKLDGVATGANLYVHPSTDGNIHLPANGTTNLNKVPKATATAGSWVLDFVAWGEIASKPTTISGFGISDAYTKTEIGDIATDFVAAFNTAIA